MLRIVNTFKRNNIVSTYSLNKYTVSATYGSITNNIAKIVYIVDFIH